MSSPSAWFYLVGEDRFGPLTRDAISKLLVSGELQPATLVWADHMSAWAPANSIPELQVDPLASRATWALVLGLVSVFGLLVPVTFVAGVAGLILGLQSRRSATKRGFALAGIWLSAVGLLVVVGLTLLIVDAVQHVGWQAVLGGFGR